VELSEEKVEQSEIEGQASEARQRGRDDDRSVAGKERLHRRRQEPELQHDEDQDEAEDPGHDRQALAAGERRKTHRVPSSTPTAKTRLSRVSSRRRGRGRRGGPARGCPVARSKTPSWHGHRRRLSSGLGITGHERCVHFWPYATKCSAERRVI